MLNFKNFLKGLLPYHLWLYFLFLYHKIKFGILNIYSCRGEIDKKLKKIIGEKKRNGFFLEIGAYNGYSESVSLRFENEFGWKGLLIEPNPIHFKYLKKNRSYNICLNLICLSKKFLKKKLFIKNLNQMSYIVDNDNKPYFNDYPTDRIKNLAKDSFSGNFKKFKCTVETLENIFKKLDIKKIDLAIIDVEGSELDLLKGINFNNVDIRYFCIESYNFKKLDKFMKKKKYSFIKKLHLEDYVYKKIS
jgi:FkbM family methyltransferase